MSPPSAETRHDPRLAAQLDADAQRQYVYAWEAEPGEHALKVRPTDGEGGAQIEEEVAPIPSGYHTVEVTVT